MCHPIFNKRSRADSIWKMIGLLAALVLLLGLPGSGSAMNSTSYKLDWFAPMTGTGGTASSAHYRLDFTMGQTVSGPAASPNFSANLGFWQALEYPGLYLPVIVR